VAFGIVWKVVMDEGAMPDVSSDSYLVFTHPERKSKTNTEITRTSLESIMKKKSIENKKEWGKIPPTHN
jgi:hypothetical protein